jgi:hypothetical protein
VGVVRQTWGFATTQPGSEQAVRLMRVPCETAVSLSFVAQCDYEPWNPTAPVDWTLFAPYPHPLNSWTHTDQKTWTLGRDLRIRSAPFHGLLTLVAYALSARSDAGMQDVIRGIFQ